MISTTKRSLILLWVGVLIVAPPVRAADATASRTPPTPGQTNFFEMKIRPVLAEKCFRCHGDRKQEGSLRLDSRADALKGGDSGAAVVPGKPEDSLLIEAIKYESFEMPPSEKLPDDQIAAMEAWVKMGAPWPAGEAVDPASKITEEDRAHWAFQPVAAPPIPEVKDEDWCRNAIDRFVLRRLEQEGISPSDEADSVALVRRVYFNLIGLPPTPDEVDAYLADESPDKYERLVDRLLDDPRYGEKWARHWLDLVRYAESDGWRQDAFRPEAYKYRDFVIRSFNEDKSYDRFVMEQIAGDEVDPGNPEAIAATAFLRHGIYEYNQRDVETQWNNILNEVTDVTSDVFLGLGMACARCHDHKFDPIPRDDYFRMRAFFEPMLWREDQPLASVEARIAHQRQLAAWEDATADIRRQLDEIERPILFQTAGGQGFSKFAPHLQTLMVKRTEERTPYEHQIATLSARQLTFDPKKIPERLQDERKADRERLWEELAKFDDLKPAPLPTHKFAVSDVGAVAPPTRIPGDRSERDIEPGFISVLGAPAPEISPPPAALESTGRRTALAKWLADPGNPLTTRVIVNRIWQYHFGTGLVATPSDFGRLGEPPTHPQLLDWLAHRFVVDGWSIKKLHRLIMTSATYRQTVFRRAPEVARKADPENRLLWRMNSRRLDAEQIRDAMLYVSGGLDPRMGGPGVAASSPRRSIYVKVIRNTRYPLFDLFDMSDGLGSSGKRNVTTTPTQALLMVNGSFVLARAEAMASRLSRLNKGDNRRLVITAYRAAYGREPTAEEIEIAISFLREQADQVKPPPEKPKGELATEKMPQTGTNAVLLKPDSTQRHLEAPFSPKLPDGDFTIEAMVLLESLYKDATVRTIAAHWDSNSRHPGWAFGVTSEKSAYKPRNLIVQLVGNNSDGKPQYEVIPSNIHLKLNTPYFVSVSVTIQDTSPKGVRFYVDDLSVANEPPQVAEAAHKVVGAYRGDFALTIGGRDRNDRHYWDGLIDTIRISRAALQDQELLIRGDSDNTNKTVGHWQFEQDGGMLTDSSRNGLALRSTRSSDRPPSAPQTAAFIDFCHVLLNSNEFIYVD